MPDNPTPPAPPVGGPPSARSRTDDLDRLADAVVGNLENVPGRRFGLDHLTPFGRPMVAWDILDLIGMPADGVPGDPGVYSCDQLDYCDGLWGDVLGHIGERWAGFRKAEGEGHPQGGDDVR